MKTNTKLSSQAKRYDITHRHSSQWYQIKRKPNKYLGFRGGGIRAYRLKHNRRLQPHVPGDKKRTELFTTYLMSDKGVDKRFAADFAERHSIDIPKTVQSIAALACILLAMSNITLHELENPNHRCALLFSPRARPSKALQERYGRDCFSTNTCNSVIKALVKAGFVRLLKKGFTYFNKTLDVTEMFPSSYTPSKRLCQLILLSPDSFRVVILKPLRELVWLHREGRLASYADTPETNFSRGVLASLNKILATTELAFPCGPLAPHELEYRRVFTCNLNSGGRLYAPIQNNPKSLRGELLIDGRPVVELDYQSLHISMLYHLECSSLACDPYQLGELAEFKRRDVKLACNIMLNATSKKAAICASKSEGISNPMVIIECIEVVHSPISRHFYSGSWRWLQKLDSDIALKVVEKMVCECGIPVVPIHDSFIVQVTHQDKLRETMIQQYKLKLGFNPTITS